MSSATAAKLALARGARPVSTEARELEYQRGMVKDIIRSTATMNDLLDSGKPLPRAVVGHCRTWQALMAVLL